LVHTKLRAEGYQLGKRFFVMPGADYCYETKSGVSVHNRARRAALEQLDIFEELPGVTDRSRLRIGLDCKSAPIAATLITGEHLDNDAWEEASLPASCDGKPA
jgi:hypothetical protein